MVNIATYLIDGHVTQSGIASVSGTFTDSLTVSGVPVSTEAPTGVALTVREVDSDPSVANVGTIVVTNATLTNDGGGQVTIDTGGGISNVVEDLSPQLGAALDAQTFDITDVGTLAGVTITGTTFSGAAAVLGTGTFDTGLTVSGVAVNTSRDHGLLEGLSDDDHTQYTLADGTRAFTGNQAMGDNNLTGINNLTFTDTAGAVAGIENQNLVDKTATESLSGAWNFTTELTVSGAAVMIDDSDPKAISNRWDFQSLTVSGLSVDTTGGGGGGGSLDNIVEDLTPQLGGDLDVNNFVITDGANNVIVLSGSTGGVRLVDIRNANLNLRGNDVLLAGGDVLTQGGLVNTAGGNVVLAGGDVSLSTGAITTAGDISFNAVTNTIASIENQNLVDKTATESLSGAWDFTTDLAASGTSVMIDDSGPKAISNTWDFTSLTVSGLSVDITAGGGGTLSNIVEDLSPQLGALLDAQTFDIVNIGRLGPADGTAADPAYTFENDSDSGMFSTSNDDLGFSVGGVEILVISGGGNNSIGVLSDVTAKVGSFDIATLTSGLPLVLDTGPKDVSSAWNYVTELTVSGSAVMIDDSDPKALSNTWDFQSLTVSGVAVDTGGTSADHGALTGLGDDDHTQYILEDGTRAFSGDQALGDNSLTGLNNITFTDTAGAVAGIENQNLVDKSATEAVAGAWDFTTELTVSGSAALIDIGPKEIGTAWNFATELTVSGVPVHTGTTVTEVSVSGLAATPGSIDFVGANGVNVSRSDQTITIDGLGVEGGGGGGGGGVDSLNTRTGAVTITGVGSIETITSGQIITVSGSAGAGYSQAFSATTSVNVTHNLGTKTHITVITDGADNQLTAQVAYGENTDVVTLQDNESGTIYVVSGGAGVIGPAGGPEDALVGADGITIISGTNITTISGFNTEFTNASGTLQTDIDTRLQNISEDTTPELGGALVAGDNNITGLNNLTFTDTEGQVAGIENKNLVDKTATEAVAGAWDFTTELTASGAAVMIDDSDPKAISNTWDFQSLTVSGVSVDTGGTSADHGALTGLGDDDHTQYTLADGSRAFTGAQAMGDQNLTGINNLTFTDVNGQVAGIENQNLVDKSATEAITGNWDFTGSIALQVSGIPPITDDAAKHIAGGEWDFDNLTVSGVPVLLDNAAKHIAGGEWDFDNLTVSGIAVDTSGAQTDHGGLTGLGDDDHTIYTKADGTRAFSGNQAMGTNKLTGLSAGTTAGDSVRFEQVITEDGANAFTGNQSFGSNDITSVGTITATTATLTNATVSGLSALTDTDGKAVSGNWDFTTGLTISGAAAQVRSVLGKGNITTVDETNATTVSGSQFESWPIWIEFPGSGIDGAGDGTQNIKWMIDYPFDVERMTAKADSGSLTYSVTLNAVTVEGLNDQAVNTTESIDFPTSALSYTTNDEIVLAISGALDVTGVRFGFQTSRT